MSQKSTALRAAAVEAAVEGKKASLWTCSKYLLLIIEAAIELVKSISILENNRYKSNLHCLRLLISTDDLAHSHENQARTENNPIANFSRLLFEIML